MTDAADPQPPTLRKRPTISDVAANAGTSKGTVSFVINGRPGVAAGTRERILAAIDELGFEPSQLARSLSKSRADTVGLMLARNPRALGSDPFFARFIAGVESTLAKADYSLLLKFVSDERAEEAVYRKLASSRQVDGVILTDLRRHDMRIALLSDLGLAAVTLNSPDVPSSHPAVCNDDAPGIREAAAHLIALGHTRIAHVTGPLEYQHTSMRNALWREHFAAAGAPPIATVVTDFTAKRGAEATRMLIGLPPSQRPTAIVFDNDTMAVAGTMAAQGMGLKVPSDLSIIGFDDAELSASVNPPLTTIQTHPFAWGKCAAQVLIDVVNGKPPKKPVVRSGASNLVVRASTAPAPG